MSQNELVLTYKLYLEAEDINQSRIISTTSFVKNLFANCGNTYLKQVKVEDESDLEDYALRLYVEHEVKEVDCTAPEDASSFILDMAEFLDKISQAHSYLEMEGSFSIDYQGRKDAYSFSSESGQDFCDFVEK